MKKKGGICRKCGKIHNKADSIPDFGIYMIKKKVVGRKI